MPRLARRERRAADAHLRQGRRGQPGLASPGARTGFHGFHGGLPDAARPPFSTYSFRDRRDAGACRRQTMARNDVAIYAPDSAGGYERVVHRVGGAERQMLLLARALSDRGHTVAHIVFPVEDPA